MFAGTAAVLAAVLFLSVRADGLSAKSAILTDGITGQVIFEKRADDKSLIASTTKIMTALLVCEKANVLDIVRIPKAAVGIEGSSVYLQEGEKLTVQELLYAMMLHSGNDAAMALAIYCGGDADTFVDAMNEKATELGMENTHFSNPHGLDGENHYSTARDLAVLARYAMKNPLFAQTVGTKSVRIQNRSLTNHNKLLWRVAGAEGIKTGYTKAAGRILVSSARRQGRRLIVVTICDGNDWADHGALYEQGFSRYVSTPIFAVGDRVGSLWVFGGAQEQVDLVAQENFSFPLAPGEEVSLCLSQKDMTFAPVVEGAFAGYVYICVDGCAVGKVAVQYAQTVEQETAPPKKNRWWHRTGG